jgi:hypothetical protein
MIGVLPKLYVLILALAWARVAQASRLCLQSPQASKPLQAQAGRLCYTHTSDCAGLRWRFCSSGCYNLSRQVLHCPCSEGGIAMMSRRIHVALGWLCLVALTLVAFNWSAGRAEGLKKVAREPRRFSFKIEPGTPVKDLLPVLPKYWAMLPGYMCETFEQIPEVTFGDPVAKIADTEKETAHILAKINHLNQSRKDDDAFMKILIGHRAELRGLPFLMGKDCRMETKQAQVFSEAVELVHQAERALRADAFVVPEDYWPTLRGLWDQKDPDIKYHRHDVVKGDGERAQVRALMQVFAIAPETYRVGLAKHLASMQHAEAAHALVQLALYAPEKAVRHAAIDSLKKHPSQDYTRLLVGGFRYPRRSSGWNARRRCPILSMCLNSRTRALP